jgi:hypothetical protein
MLLEQWDHSRRPFQIRVDRNRPPEELERTPPVAQLKVDLPCARQCTEVIGVALEHRLATLQRLFVLAE